MCRDREPCSQGLVFFKDKSGFAIRGTRL
ncbi:hypothetical protein NC653_012176 [Populus alba x Populus x berolinensis]|uniref:Uncharacterized protein n=1 Tax=Populus alba x Populus x berolinensis TaxID=444605 RepID=A0AAD6R430_9ROSI|nr:hypothetical protein NC653_012176 [Populus alba x Populus x berolinensis]